MTKTDSFNSLRKKTNIAIKCKNLLESYMVFCSLGILIAGILCVTNTAASITFLI